MAHTLHISDHTPGYRFAATYVGKNKVGPNEQYPILLGDTDVNGNTSVNIIHQINKYRMKFQGQIQVNAFNKNFIIPI